MTTTWSLLNLNGTPTLTFNFELFSQINKLVWAAVFHITASDTFSNVCHCIAWVPIFSISVHSLAAHSQGTEPLSKHHTICVTLAFTFSESEKATSCYTEDKIKLNSKSTALISSSPIPCSSSETMRSHPINLPRNSLQKSPCWCHSKGKRPEDHSGHSYARRGDIPSSHLPLSRIRSHGSNTTSRDAGICNLPVCWEEEWYREHIALTDTPCLRINFFNGTHSPNKFFWEALQRGKDLGTPTSENAFL